ncbi:transcriptional regulator [Mesorhizobium xinjiangense]|uniref:transcriptional regulator n=1 Tax=Mesorhizobium xinjiangense TaxID=2678685 RepID=UPI0012EEB743|nr:transcriptional regulator [Mesorhizobium xinjiangense]
MALDLDALSGLHIQRAWFAAVDFPSGLRRLHTGLGPKEIGGFTWEGISDPFGGQLVSVGSIEEPDFGQAPKVDVVMSGANKAFLKSMWDDRHAVEGAACDLYFAIFDAETGEALSGLEHMFPGKITAPKFAFTGATIRAIQLSIVSEWEGLNFPATGAMWSPAGQRARYPGDAGLDYINVPATEFYRK